MNADTPASRRRFLGQSATLLAASAVSVAAQAGDEQTIATTAGKNDLFRVRVEMEVEGNVNVPKNPLVSRKRSIQLPLKSDATFDYEERYQSRGGRVQSLERFFHQAESTNRLNRSESTLGLRPSVQDTLVSRQRLPEVVYAVEDYFHREELDLLRVPASSAAVDELLPKKPVRKGSTYQPEPAVLASVLNLTSVEASDVEVVVASISSKEVKFELKGKLDGSIEGVPTVMRIAGKLTFDRAAKTCTWLALGLHETREIGIAEPGFDIAAKVRMVRQPISQPVALPKKRRSLSAKTSPERLYIELGSDELGISMLMDRRWRMMSDAPGFAMMRMIDRDRSVAQCDFRPLVSVDPGTQWTMDAFQADVRRTLGEQLIELNQADVQTSRDGTTVLRVAANGAVQGVPIHWIILHFQDPNGRRVLATFTMEGSRRELFGGADAQLAGSLRFVNSVQQTADEPSVDPSETPSAPADKKEVAANLGEAAEPQVQSGTSRR